MLWLVGWSITFLWNVELQQRRQRDALSIRSRRAPPPPFWTWGNYAAAVIAGIFLIAFWPFILLGNISVWLAGDDESP